MSGTRCRAIVLKCNRGHERPKGHIVLLIDQLIEFSSFRREAESLRRDPGCRRDDDGNQRSARERIYRLLWAHSV